MTCIAVPNIAPKIILDIAIEEYLDKLLFKVILFSAYLSIKSATSLNKLLSNLLNVSDHKAILDKS